ncbi:hypothetical protein BSKO_07135 [Bryopsis sp. KO-2023]|nr:hypothetical protein BSKO_07135 [Bryopsis sp. KO-2023]
MKETATGQTPAQNAQDYPEASEEFMMYSFKVLPCCKGYRHNWKRCPFAHEGESERRRDPRIFKYTAVVCPATKKGVQCPRGDKCPWAHNVFEYWLHPLRYDSIGFPMHSAPIAPQAPHI